MYFGINVVTWYQSLSDKIEIHGKYTKRKLTFSIGTMRHYCIDISLLIRDRDNGPRLLAFKLHFVMVLSSGKRGYNHYLNSHFSVFKYFACR